MRIAVVLFCVACLMVTAECTNGPSSYKRLQEVRHSNMLFNLRQLYQQSVGGDASTEGERSTENGGSTENDAGTENAGRDIGGVNSHWSSWTSWGQCSATCGGSLQTRTRSCSIPATSADGQMCLGNDEQWQSCIKNPCPIDGRWTNWSKWTNESWGKCSRTRTCIGPFVGGQACPGKNYEIKTSGCI